MAKTSATRFLGIASLGGQCLLVLVIGSIFAFAANRISPRGLALGRDYFPAASEPIPVAPEIKPTRDKPTHEFPTVTLGDIEEMIGDPRYVTRQFLLIDARNDAQFRAGHIPGAIQFDRYQPQNYLSAVLPACLAAQKIVIYCGGGNCEDSIFAARALRDFGVPADRFFIFTGGVQSWRDAELPLSAY